MKVLAENDAEFLRILFFGAGKRDGKKAIEKLLKQ